MRDYIDIGYKPKDKEVLASYYIEGNRVSVKEVANNLAGESSIDTWTDIRTLDASIAKRLSPHVYSIHGNYIKVAYSPELFEKGNMSQILSSLAGNVFGLKLVKHLRLIDIRFPRTFVKSFKGPRYGIEGIRKLTKIKERPFIGTIIKPKLGLDEKRHALVAYEAWRGGCDVVKDDENLTNMSFNKFRKRIDVTLKMRDRAESETGEIKLYMPNITAETIEMLRRADYVRENNGNYVMVDVLTSGFSAVNTLRNNTRLPIHAHRAMHAALTRDEKEGINMAVLAKIFRLIGVDTLHIGTAMVGKMGSHISETLDSEREIEFRKTKKYDELFEQRWYGTRRVMAVASGGLQPLMIGKVVDKMGKNVVLNFGGGIHAHPWGTRAGATAARQALDAYLNGIRFEVYAKKRNELGQAIEKWGL
ncbi:MAG: type III ribulose-bisphosphate carboxylase [Candidatus Nanoarchaeia archaeon]|nr:type III ribulose-bisphosphate carboxylase [Candidatus Nanoarchaeia archaeon]